jgi:2-isopropylmalate synthase
MVPDEMTELILYLRQNVRAIERVCLSVQCQNGFGLATANSLAAVIAGVRQIQCALGTRGLDSGNCSLEGFVRALTTREAFFNADTSIDTTRMSPTCRLGSGITGTPDRPIKRQFQGIFNEHNGM